MNDRPNSRRICFALQMLLLLLLARNSRAQGQAQSLPLPPRLADALSGSQFADSITNLDRSEREEKIYGQIVHGNVPNFLRHLCPVQVQSVEGNQTNSAVYYVTPDYLAVGSDADYFLTPLTPIMAQKVANLLNCCLPTEKMVNDIYSAAVVKLTPSPIPPSPLMATVPIFIQHNLMVRSQRQQVLSEHPLGALVAGDKKDVVIFAKLPTTPGKVGIYGWHKPEGKAIQPLFTGHGDTYADYSHGIRLVRSFLLVNGRMETIPDVLADPKLAGLLSDEGPLTQTEYPTVFYASTLPATAGVTTTNHAVK